MLFFLKNTFLDVCRLARSPGEGVKSLYGVSFYRNALYLVQSSVIGPLLGFAFWLIAARFYSTSDIGIASALIAGMGLLSSLSLSGLNIGLVRFLPEEEDKRGMINSCFTIVGMYSIVLAVIFIVGAPLWSPALSFLWKDMKFPLSFVIFTMMTSLFLIQGQAFVALRAAKFAFSMQMISQGLKVALVAMLVSFGVFGIFSSWGIPALIAVLVGNLFFLRKVQPGYFPFPSIKKRMVSDIAHFSLRNYGAEVIRFGGAPLYILPLMVVNVLGAEPSAYFRIALGIATMFFMVPGVITMALFAEGSCEPEKFHTNVIKAIKLIFLLLLPATLVILLLGDKILYLFGSEYSENGLKVLWILALSSIPLAINELYVVMKRVELKVKPVIYVYSGIIIPTLGGSYVLMNTVGLTGVGLGWILGQGAVAIFTSVLIVRWLISNKEKPRLP